MKDIIKKYRQYGLNAVPCHPKKKYPVLSHYKDFYETMPDFQELAARAKSWDAVGILCGRSSRNLEALDFDTKNIPPQHRENVIEFWYSLAEDAVPGIVQKVLQERTPSGGMHWLYRCREDIIRHNTKLASGDGTNYWLETRGNDGFIVTAPTTGYSVEAGRFNDIPTLTPQEYLELHTVASTLNNLSWGFYANDN